MSSETDTPRKGYAIFVEEITDWEQYLNEYLPPAGETVDRHDGELTVWDDDPEVIEGEWDHNMTVIIEFPSVEDARAWYNDPEYEEIKSIRHDACKHAHAIITSGVSESDLPE